MLLSGEGLCGFHAASTAAEVSGAVVSLPVRGLRLNWCFLIFSASSMPRMVTAAVSNRWNPSIGAGADQFGRVPRSPAGAGSTADSLYFIIKSLAYVNFRSLS